MINLTSLPAVAAVLLGVLVAAAPAQAQLMRTFVSAAVGNDASDCSFATPCRSFQGAHDKTLADGEITVLAPGGYGAVTITKSISIVNDGVGVASILVSGGATGITINAPADAHVNLRGLTVQGIGFGGGTGLFLGSGLSLTISKCVVRNHSGEGIFFQPEVGGSHLLSISDTLVADNAGDGILITSAGAQDTAVRAAIERVRVVNNKVKGVNVSGLFSTGAVTAVVTDSVIANNGDHGVFVISRSDNAATSVMVTSSVLSGNVDAGIVADVASTVRFAQSVITGNRRAFGIGGTGTLRSFGDNYIAGNSDGDPAPPTTPRK